jgi:branched-chain amino acid transport system ATP-binding protein
MFAYRLGLSSAELESRIERAKEVFPWIADRSAQNAATLSGGEQQMLAIAQALVVRPKILLIDEFSLGLSPKIVGELIDVVRTISENGTAVLLVEQSASVACEVADRVYALERGSIVLAEDSTILAAEPERLTNLYLQGSATQGSSV